MIWFCWSVKWKSGTASVTWTANGANKRLVLHMQLGWPGSLSITISVSLLANVFDVPIVLHGQISLAAVNQISVIHEAMNVAKI